MSTFGVSVKAERCCALIVSHHTGALCDPSSLASRKTASARSVRQSVTIPATLVPGGPWRSQGTAPYDEPGAGRG